MCEVLDNIRSLYKCASNKPFHTPLKQKLAPPICIDNFIHHFDVDDHLNFINWIDEYSNVLGIGTRRRSKKKKRDRYKEEIEMETL
ncbi:hypothetical protein ACJX0J_012073, partial [Zea mays]